MRRLQLRIKPKRSLLDIDIVLIRKRLAVLQGVAEINIADDRASDGTFITVIVHFFVLDKSLIANLKKTLLRIPKVIPFVVDKRGDEMPMSSMNEEEIILFAE